MTTNEHNLFHLDNEQDIYMNSTRKMGMALI